MENAYDYRQFAILYVDDEEESLKYFARVLSPHFRILTASDAEQGFRTLEEHKDEIGLLLTDQRMPGEKGVQLLEKARRLRPRILRVLVTAHADLDAAIRAVNSGAIYKYINKPWHVPELEMTLRRGLEFFLVQRERDQLLSEKLSVLHGLMMTDRVVSLGILAAGLNHHIRNSLVAIRTFLDLAPVKLKEENVEFSDLKNPHFWQDFYQHVQAQLSRITSMLTDLGVASEKPASPCYQEVKLHEVLAGVLTSLAPRFRAKRIVLDNQITETLPPLRVDDRKFQRLFELLFTDELSQLPEGSRILIRGGPPRRPTAARPRSNWRFTTMGPVCRTRPSGPFSIRFTYATTIPRNSASI